MPSRKAGSTLLERRAQVKTLNRDPFTSIGVLDACGGIGTLSRVTPVALANGFCSSIEVNFSPDNM
jgi:hypothetical protein